MPKSKNKSVNHSSHTKRLMELPPSALVFRGPIKDIGDRQDLDLHTQTLHYSTFIYSDASGKMTNSYGNAPAPAQDWSSFQSVYREYRTLGFQLRYRPSNRYSKTTTTCNPLATVVDRVSTTALTSYMNAAGYASFAIRSLEDPFDITVNMSGPEEADFLSTGSPVDVNFIKFYSELLSVSTLYGLILIDYKVQFRGRY